MLSAVDDPDRRHHAFVLVFEDVAMEHEAAELRSFEPDHHEYPRARRERVIVVQQSAIHGRDESPVTEALDCRRPRARRSCLNTGAAGRFGHLRLSQLPDGSG